MRSAEDVKDQKEDFLIYFSYPSLGNINLNGHRREIYTCI
jgi:hypothetical protein